MGRFETGRETVEDFRDGLGHPQVGPVRDEGPLGKSETGVGTLD